MKINLSQDELAYRGVKRRDYKQIPAVFLYVGKSFKWVKSVNTYFPVDLYTVFLLFYI